MLLPVLTIYAIASVVTLAAYGWDKRCAILGRRRISERTLHGLALVGGWPGAVIGQQCFRHKRRKVGFMLITVAIILAHVGAWFFVLWHQRG